MRAMIPLTPTVRRLVVLAIVTVIVVGAGAVSAAHGAVYWANSNEGGIRVASLDGSGVRQLIGANNPCGVAVDEQYIYWAVGGWFTIGRSRLDGTDYDPDFITGVTYPCGVAVTATHIYWANGGAGGSSIGRAKLDGTGVEPSFVTGAIQPAAVAVDDTYVYWANRGPEWAGNATIGRASLDGTSVDQNFITGASSPCGVAVDDGRVYWTNHPVRRIDGGYIVYETNTIGRANLDGASPDQDFITGLFRSPLDDSDGERRDANPGRSRPHLCLRRRASGCAAYRLRQ